MDQARQIQGISVSRRRKHAARRVDPVSPMATRPPIHETRSQFLAGVTVTRIYINSSAKEAFTHLFDAFFAAVKQVTGKSVRFKVFHPKGNLYSIHFDMEAAQVQGLGTWLSKMVLDDPALRALFPSINPDDLVKFILKICCVHLERTHKNQKLRAWYKHKVQYPWLLPGYNESLSSFPEGYWQQSPSHTNLVESAHVASNRATKINVLPVDAVRKHHEVNHISPRARIFDAQKAASIAAARETCILGNRNNHDQMRIRRNSIIEVQGKLANTTQSKKDLTAELKALKSQKKELGRVPRHSGSEKSGSDIEPVDSNSPPAMSSSPFDSPGPQLRATCTNFWSRRWAQPRIQSDGTRVPRPDVHLLRRGYRHDFTSQAPLDVDFFGYANVDFDFGMFGAAPAADLTCTTGPGTVLTTNSSSPPFEWPSLPPIPVSTPPSDLLPTSPPAPPPLGRKCQRRSSLDSLEPSNMIDEPRVRKVRVRTS
ncbi:hypothetical protein B0H10DRAFT_2197610 [Mycena sp. CBHHK59/15]|nr:hypothetical protein B0H10DRAFT_2197610 [Mycena sp. CBHHK59/15]